MWKCLDSPVRFRQVADRGGGLSGSETTSDRGILVAKLHPDGRTMMFLQQLQQDIVRFTPADLGALRRFQQEVFGPRSLQLDERHFSWLHERHPLGPEGPEIYICRKEGQVVGQQAALPIQLKVEQRLQLAHWAIDLMVHPAWHLRGVGPALVHRFNQTYPIGVGIGASQPGHRLFTRCGWTDLGRIPTFFHVFDLHRLLRGHAPQRRILGQLARLAWPFTTLADGLIAAYARSRRLQARMVDEFDGRVDALWYEASSHYPVIAERSFSSLRWRFDQVPERNRYQRLYLLEQERLCGYAVLRRIKWNDDHLGVIVDHLAAPRWQAALLAHGLARLYRMGVAAAICCASHPTTVFALRSLGFFPRRSGTSLLLRLAEQYAPLRQQLGKLENWYLTFADSDVEHYQGS